RLDVIRRDELDPEPSRQHRRCLGCGHTAHVETTGDALAKRAHERGRRPPRAEADDLATGDVAQRLSGERRRSGVGELRRVLHAASASLSARPSSSARVRIRAVTADAIDPSEDWCARGVPDGLPVVPPTAERVRAAVAASGRRGDELIGLVAPANGRATVERVAVNAVMAGCRPEYLPVVLAAVDAICDPDFALVGVSGTTDAVTPLVIVNGPLRRTLEINCAASVFGAGFRANATIGRAVRLVWVNLRGPRPRAISMSTSRHPRPHSHLI